MLCNTTSGGLCLVKIQASEDADAKEFSVLIKMCTFLALIWTR